LLVSDTLLVNESSPTAENGALYQSSAGNTRKTITFDTMVMVFFYEEKRLLMGFPAL